MLRRTHKIKVTNVHIPYWPHDLQRQIHQDQHRFRVLDWGRRGGKTWWLVAECNQIGVDVWRKTKRKARIWIVAPTFPLVKETWRVANEMLKNCIIDKRETDLWMDLPWSEIEFKSAEHGDQGLRGAGLDAVGVDEASRVKREAWEYGLRPALSDRRGRGVFISTPKGQNWFYEMWLSGQEGSEKDPDVKSWKFTTLECWEALYGKKKDIMEGMRAEWETIKRTTPEIIFKQEFLAEFLEDESTVFHGLNKCIRGVFEPPIRGEQYVIGADLAKTVDFTVLTVLKKYDNQVVCVERFNEVSWYIQKERIKALSSFYNKARVVLDSSGLGDPIVEDLSREGVWAEGYKFNSTTKQELVEELMVVIEQGLVGIPPEATETIHEMRMFEYELLASGRIRYQAPEGRHDDCVISLGLAVMGMRHELHLKREERFEKPKGLTMGDYIRQSERKNKLSLEYASLAAYGMSKHEVQRMLSR